MKNVFENDNCSWERKTFLKMQNVLKTKKKFSKINTVSENEKIQKTKNVSAKKKRLDVEKRFRELNTFFEYVYKNEQRF